MKKEEEVETMYMERETLLERNHGWFTLRYAVCIPSNGLYSDLNHQILVN
jgi:hypothetical protein